MRDYLAWHDMYERLGSRLHLRLLMVQDLIATALDESPPGPVRVISMCAGQGQDVLTVTRRHRRGDDLVGRLVEIDRRNVEAARAAIADAGITTLEVVEGDAAWSEAYVGAAPADLVLACGIFGNITDEEVKATIEFLPALCAPGAFVIWTRVPRDDGILEQIQQWFRDAGFQPRVLVVGEGDLFGVGAARFHGEPQELRPGIRLFEFFR
jgi:Putative methyltransferase